ncbi:MAG: hypothetical protein Ct9H300mP9_5110 [Candidatus Neomarinimicrobiota bacterium]|nr:MAG: hypothetical protein Ct9H300mP9_5110 [Candidatus Neomarinimicrobiota bacterium]
MSWQVVIMDTSELDENIPRTDHYRPGTTKEKQVT